MLGDWEVARCKYVLAGPRTERVFGELLHGQLGILALEVAGSMRRKGLGRASVQVIGIRIPFHD